MRRLVVGLDDGTGAVRAEDVLDADGDAGDALLEGEIVDDFAAVESEFAGLVRCERGEEAGGRDFAWVGGENAVDFFPDLELGGLEADGDEGGAEVAVATAEGVDETIGDAAEETGDDRDTVVA